MMRVMNCQDIRRQIEEAELGQYPDQETSAHLRACEPCRNFRQERESLRRLVGSLETVEAPADFDFRLRARLSAAKEASRRRHLFGFLPAPSAPAIALAASFAVLVAAAVLFQQMWTQGPARQGREAVAKLAPAPTKDALSSRATMSEPEISGENSARTPRADVMAAKSAQTGPKTLTAELKPRARASRILKQSEERAEPFAASAIAAGQKSTFQEFSSSPATVISLVAVQVPATNQPMKVSLEDRRGETRTVSLQPVTFGSQELIERKGASRVLTSSAKGIW